MPPLPQTTFRPPERFYAANGIAPGTIITKNVGTLNGYATYFVNDYGRKIDAKGCIAFPAPATEEGGSAPRYKYLHIPKATVDLWVDPTTPPPPAGNDFYYTLHDVATPAFVTENPGAEVHGLYVSSITDMYDRIFLDLSSVTEEGGDAYVWMRRCRKPKKNEQTSTLKLWFRMPASGGFCRGLWAFPIVVSPSTNKRRTVYSNRLAFWNVNASVPGGQDPKHFFTRHLSFSGDTARNSSMTMLEAKDKHLAGGQIVFRNQ